MNQKCLNPRSGSATLENIHAVREFTKEKTEAPKRLALTKNGIASQLLIKIMLFFLYFFKKLRTKENMYFLKCFNMSGFLE
jgi:hypothetical protein